MVADVVKRTVSWLAVPACLIVSAVTVDAQAIFYNDLGSSIAGSLNVSVQHAYNSFSNGPSPGIITDVEVSLTTLAPIASGTTTVSLYADSSTSPGTLISVLGTIADTSIPTTAHVFDIFPISTINLAANQRYWIGISDTVTKAKWDYTNSLAGTTGVSSEYTSNGGVVTANTSGSPYLMRVSLETPEPGAFGLLVSGLVCSGLLVRRKRSKVQQ